MFDIAVLDMAEPEPLLDEGLGALPLGAGDEGLLSLDAGAAPEEGEELESPEQPVCCSRAERKINRSLG